MRGGLYFDLVDCIFHIWSQIKQNLLQCSPIVFQILDQLLLVSYVMEHEADRRLWNRELIQRGEIGIILVGNQGAELGFNVVFVEVFRAKGDSESNVCFINVDGEFLLVLNGDEQRSQLSEEFAGLLSAEGGEKGELFKGDLSILVGVNLIKDLIKVSLGN